MNFVEKEHKLNRSYLMFLNNYYRQNNRSARLSREQYHVLRNGGCQCCGKTEAQLKVLESINSRFYALCPSCCIALGYLKDIEYLVKVHNFIIDNIEKLK